MKGFLVNLVFFFYLFQQKQNLTIYSSKHFLLNFKILSLCSVGKISAICVSVSDDTYSGCPRRRGCPRAAPATGSMMSRTFRMSPACRKKVSFFKSFFCKSWCFSGWFCSWKRAVYVTVPFIRIFLFWRLHGRKKRRAAVRCVSFIIVYLALIQFC